MDFVLLHSSKSKFLLMKSEKIEIKDAVQDKKKNAKIVHLLNMEQPVVRYKCIVRLISPFPRAGHI